MSLVYEKFDVFLGTYSETSQHFISGDVAQLIMNHITSQLYIVVNEIIHEHVPSRQSCNEFEIFTDELTGSFTQPSYYRMDWIYNLDNDQIETFKQAEDEQEIASKFLSQPSVASETTRSDKFYDHAHCLSFISFRFGVKCDGIYQVSLMDIDDNIINSTKWILYEKSAPTVIFTSHNQPFTIDIFLKIFNRHDIFIILIVIF